MKSTTGVNVMKLFLFIGDEETTQVRVFVPERPFKPMVIYLLILDHAENAYKLQTL